MSVRKSKLSSLSSLSESTEGTKKSKLSEATKRTVLASIKSVVAEREREADLKSVLQKVSQELDECVKERDRLREELQFARTEGEIHIAGLQRDVESCASRRDELQREYDFCERKREESEAVRIQVERQAKERIDRYIFKQEEKLQAAEEANRRLKLENYQLAAQMEDRKLFVPRATFDHEVENCRKFRDEMKVYTDKLKAENEKYALKQGPFSPSTSKRSFTQAFSFPTTGVSQFR